jgi:hypothetical protein
MERKLKNRLEEIFGALYIYSPAEYAFGGERFSTAEVPLAAALQGKFYQYCYMKEFALPLTDSGASVPATDLAPLLSQANRTPERWDFGWKCYQMTPQGAAYAQKDSQARMFWPGEFLAFDGTGAGPPQNGSWGRVYLAKEDIRSQPGFYVVNSEIAPSLEDQYSFVRFYWNIAPETAIPLVRTVSERFNRMRVPFSFKTLRYASAYGRADAAVLYVGRRYYTIAARLAAEAYRIVKNGMKPGIPLFTKPLAPGLGLAEDPSGGESFGTCRARIMAESVSRAYLKRQQSDKARMGELEGLFAENGWSLDLPHLCLSSVDLYDSEESFATL